ncbi:MAG: hypothetical protein K2M64_03355, partial [Clostridia bacterium]|nr:hypothetical protein [Clostridia bacterium]
ASYSDENKYFEVNDIVATYGDTITIPTITPITGYEGEFTWEYADTDKDYTDPSIQWAPNIFTRAGEYLIRITLKGNANFTDKVAYAKLTINKKDLHITLSGSVEYGNAFAQGSCKYTINENDLVDRDKGVANLVSGAVYNYLLVDSDGTAIADTSKLSAGTYNLTVELADGAVRGLTANNYRIVLTTDEQDNVVYGSFTVSPRKVTVTIGNASGMYGIMPDLTSVDVATTDAFAIDEVLPNIVLKTNATDTSVVGKYAIYTEYRNGNFDIEYKNENGVDQNGEYEVTARKINVTLVDNNSDRIYNGVIGAVTIATITDINGVDITEWVKGKNYLTVMYSRTTNKKKTKQNKNYKGEQ